jgi:hypothetical protein
MIPFPRIFICVFGFSQVIKVYSLREAGDPVAVGLDNGKGKDHLPRVDFPFYSFLYYRVLAIACAVI